MVSVLLADYLTRLGFSPFQVGAIVTATLLGSAALTLAIGLVSHRLGRRAVLFGASALMACTGLAFAGVTSFWPLLLVAFVGTINPSAGDVTLFLPAEQALLADTASGHHRTTVFAWYNLAGAVAGAIGALCSGLPEPLARRLSIEVASAERAGFLVYAAIGVLAALLYRRLPPQAAAQTSSTAGPLAKSRRIVLQLSALFSLDAFGYSRPGLSFHVAGRYRRLAADLNAP